MLNKGFNPHPARRPDAIRDDRHRLVDVVFQSSPGQKAGCNGSAPRNAHLVCSFNPHPARRPDAMAQLPVMPISFAVSILTRPEGRMQCYRPNGPAVLHPVSILTRPEGRMQFPVQGQLHLRIEVSILTRPEVRMQCRGVQEQRRLI